MRVVCCLVLSVATLAVVESMASASNASFANTVVLAQEPEPTPTPPASLPGNETDNNSNADAPDENVTTDVTIAIGSLSDPVVGATRASDAGRSVEAAWPGPNDPDCVEVESTMTTSADGTEISLLSCAAVYACGAERIDDTGTGRIAGQNIVGRYGAYVAQLVEILGSEALRPTLPVPTAASVDEVLQSQGLQSRPDELAIPIFYWCAKQTSDGALGDVEISAPPPFNARIGWDTTVEDEYDIPGVRQALLIELEATLGLYKPELATMPPLDNGFTFVQWPTWFWIDNPIEDEHIYATNSTDTLRIDMRARLTTIDWHFGGELLITCTPDQMRPFNEGDDPVNNKPECHHIFTQLDTADFAATINYTIEDDVRSRLKRLGDDYPPLTWDLHDQRPEIPLTSTFDDYEIHQIVTVNTSDS